MIMFPTEMVIGWWLNHHVQIPQSHLPALDVRISQGIEVLAAGWALWREISSFKLLQYLFKIFQCGTTMLNQEIPLPLRHLPREFRHPLHNHGVPGFWISISPLKMLTKSKNALVMRVLFLLRPEQKPFTKKKRVSKSHD